MRKYPYKRSVRVADLLHHEIADIVLHKLKDPRLGFVTITGVDLTNDLRFGKVYFTDLDDSKIEETLKILTSSKGFIKKELAGRVKLKFIPDFEFKKDDSILYGRKIDKILAEIKEKEQGDQ
jgi:ribosome-binding factor A